MSSAARLAGSRFRRRIAWGQAANAPVIVHPKQKPPSLQVGEGDQLLGQSAVVDTVGVELDAGVLASGEQLEELGLRQRRASNRASSRAQGGNTVQPPEDPEASRPERPSSRRAIRCARNFCQQARSPLYRGLITSSRSASSTSATRTIVRNSMFRTWPENNREIVGCVTPNSRAMADRENVQLGPPRLECLHELEKVTLRRDARRLFRTPPPPQSWQDRFADNWLLSRALPYAGVRSGASHGPHPRNTSSVFPFVRLSERTVQVTVAIPAEVYPSRQQASTPARTWGGGDAQDPRLRTCGECGFGGGQRTSGGASSADQSEMVLSAPVALAGSAPSARRRVSISGQRLPVLE